MPYEEKESYTTEEMADYIANEAGSGAELLQMLASHGFQLSSGAPPVESPCEEAAEELVEESEEAEEEPAMMLPPMPDMVPKKKPAGLDIVALRVGASKKAIDKHKGGSDER
jgi:hypothetical protein